MVRGRINLWVKLLYTAFVSLLVPYYWKEYTPWNFLYFCDVALLVTLAAIWLENALLASTQAVAILLPQALWVADFLFRAVAGIHITGMTGYMFNSNIPWYVRGLSSFHGWLPFLLLWLLARLGYDRRALAYQTVLGLIVLGVSYTLAPAPPPPAAHPSAAVNVNYVYGLDDQRVQTIMSPHLWFAILTAITIVGFYVPTHFVLRRLFPRSRSVGVAKSAARAALDI
jgi:hypothetical protein